jgi:hypothetical protein
VNRTWALAGSIRIRVKTGKRQRKAPRVPLRRYSVLTLARARLARTAHMHQAAAAHWHARSHVPIPEPVDRRSARARFRVEILVESGSDSDPVRACLGECGTAVTRLAGGRRLFAPGRARRARARPADRSPTSATTDPSHCRSQPVRLGAAVAAARPPAPARPPRKSEPGRNPLPTSESVRSPVRVQCPGRRDRIDGQGPGNGFEPSRAGSPEAGGESSLRGRAPRFRSLPALAR